MKRYMVTHSLLSSWLYAIQDNPYEDATTERDPMAEFLTVLRREPTGRTEAMPKGNAFEDLVAAILSGAGDQTNSWYNAANRVAGTIRGGILQYSAKKQIRVGNRDVLLSGRLDALKGGVIYDIKYSGSYEAGRYLTAPSTQCTCGWCPRPASFPISSATGRISGRKPTGATRPPT